MKNDLKEEIRQGLLEELFHVLEPEKMGGAYREALQAGDENSLIRAAAGYFRSRPDRPYCRDIDLSDCTRENADRAAAGDVTVINIPWHFPEGDIDWLFNPTLAAPPVNHEWLWQLSRMSFWKDMSAAFMETRDEKYAAAFNSQVRSWIAAAGLCGKEWNVSGSVWRTIEAGLRMMYSWPLGFETFRRSRSFTDENLCLMLGSMYRQCVHLQEHRTKNNWLLMEMSGLYTFGALFPEFKCASAMRQTAAGIFSRAIMEQILPDGMHNELSSDYHGVMLMCSAVFLNIASSEGIANELPPEFLRKLELSFESILNMAAPGLVSPRTNDSYTISVAERMRVALKYFPDREDFRWGASSREKGKAPPDTPTSSRFLPWAGFAVMRSDWGADAAYCCFDTGPLGMGHMHQDKLNINIWKGQDELIYDDGGGQYERSPFRAYGVSSAAHNVVLVDGLVQRRLQPRKSDVPINAHWMSNEKFDYACSTYDDDFGPVVYTEADMEVPLCRPASHSREVRFCKPDIFCVKDRLFSLDGQEHSFEMRLHMDTLKVDEVSAIPGAYLSDIGGVWDVLIIPLYPEELEIRLISGGTAPHPVGWFVGRNDKTLHAGTTLTMSVREKKDFTFATLLIPVRRSEALPEIEKSGNTSFAVCFRGRRFVIDPEHLAE